MLRSAFFPTKLQPDSGCLLVRSSPGSISGNHLDLCTKNMLTHKRCIRGPARTSTKRNLAKWAHSCALGLPFPSSVWTFSNNKSISVLGNTACKGDRGAEEPPSQTCTCCSCEKPCRCGSNQPKPLLNWLFSCTSRKFPHSVLRGSTSTKESENLTLISRDSGREKEQHSLKYQMVLEWFSSYKLLNIYMAGREWRLNLLSIFKTPSNGFLPHL